jgi:hypothetical protein
LTTAGVAAKLGVHRRIVRRAVAGVLLPVQDYPEWAKPKLGAVADFIDKVLDEDRRAPRKQPHGAAHSSPYPEGVPRRRGCHVRERKRQIGLDRRETFVPQSYR